MEKTIIKARGVILKENKVFLLRDVSSRNFIYPGGKQEPGETIKDTFYREMLEETGVNAEIDKLIGITEYIGKKTGKITLEFLFKIKNILAFENINKGNCSHGFEWHEAGFYSIDELKAKGVGYPENLENVVKLSLKEDLFCQILK